MILIDLIASVFLALFGAVYEAFGHGVWSYGTVYAFAFPLVLGVLPLYLIGYCRATVPGRIARCAYHAGIATLSVGSLVSGALEIYGTTSPLIVVYWVLGAALTLLGAGMYLVSRMQKRKKA